MKFTLPWLKEHLDTKARVDEVAETLTSIGLEVEEVFDPETALAPFKVAQVLSAASWHPDIRRCRCPRLSTS